MPNYDKLLVPTLLTYCKDKIMVQQTLGSVLANAKQGEIEQAPNQFYKLINTVAGTAKCADFWVFVVRFYVISRQVPLAVEALHLGFSYQAQPLNLLQATQQSLQELQKKLEKQSTPKNMAALSQIQLNFFEQSQTLMSSPPKFVKWTEEQIKMYENEKVEQQAFQQQNMQAPSQILGRIE